MLPHCSHCGASGARRVCGACAFTPYCSERCAEQDWSTHCEARDEVTLSDPQSAHAMDLILPLPPPASLWLGSIAALDQLDAHSIGAVVTVLPEDSPRFDRSWLRQCVGPQRAHLWLSYHDVPDAPIAECFERATSWIATQLGAGRAVLIHCHAGVSRSATIMAAYLLRHHGDRFTSVPAVLAYLKRCRPIVEPNPGFLAQLEGWRRRKSE